MSFRAAENLAIPFRLPFEVVLRDMQTSLKQEGYWAVAARIWKTQGILGFYKGWLSPMFMGFRSGIQQSIFDQLKQARLGQLSAGGIVLTELSFATAFIFGSIGRFFATLATFPLLRAKIMAMSDDSNRPAESKGLGVIGCLGYMYRREGGGLLGMYQVRCCNSMRTWFDVGLLLSGCNYSFEGPRLARDFGRKCRGQSAFKLC
jgi:hypothetical protein